MPLSDEIAEGSLIQQWSMAHTDRLRGGESVHHSRRHDEVGETKRGKQNFVKGTGVDDHAGAIQSLEGGDGAALVAIFAVVVVLEDQGARTPGPFQQRQTPAQAHSDSQRKLVRRSYVDELGARPAPAASLQVQAFGINRNRADLGANGPEDDVRTRITGVFDPDRIPGID